MFPVRFAIATAVLAVATPLMAQSTVQPAPNLPPTRPLQQDRGYDKDTPRVDAVNAVEAPVTARLNEQEGSSVGRVEATDQAQYDADMAAYRTAVQAHARQALRDEARYARQQRAYADAMTAWRVQARDCQKGSRAACNAPPPDPAAFY